VKRTKVYAREPDMYGKIYWTYELQEFKLRWRVFLRGGSYNTAVEAIEAADLRLKDFE